jgi:hypothetical protein
MVMKIKSGQVYSFLILCLALLTSCASTAASNANDGLAYAGENGKGINLAILAPGSNGLAADQNYLPALAQREFANNFSSHSAMSVMSVMSAMDRQNLDSVYAELLSYHDDNHEARLDLGRSPAIDYIMYGSIAETATGYSLQIQITKTSDKMTAASYSGTCDFAEMDNLMGLRRVSLDLLSKMGVELAPSAKTALSRAATERYVKAQTIMAKGIAAQMNGAIIEAMSYYYEAARFDPSLKEAEDRLSAIAAVIRAGNIGAGARKRTAERSDTKSLDIAD